MPENCASKTSPIITSTLSSHDISVFEPEVSHQVNAEEPSSLIILFGWMGAKHSFLLKYVQGHQLLFPTSSIVLVKANSVFLFTSEAKREENLNPLADLIIERVYNNKSTRGILFHCISNGGGFQLIYLSRALFRKLAPLKPQVPTFYPPIAIIIDSAPGRGEYRSMLKFFITSAGIQSPLIKMAAPFPTAIIFMLYYGMTAVRGMPALLSLLHSLLETLELVPKACGATPRLYIFSDADDMVDPTFVERHLDAIRRLGCSFTVEKYSGSRHVSHMKQDPQRYWSAVKYVWGKARTLIRQEDPYKCKL